MARTHLNWPEQSQLEGLILMPLPGTVEASSDMPIGPSMEMEQNQLTEQDKEEAPSLGVQGV